MDNSLIAASILLANQLLVGNAGSTRPIATPQNFSTGKDGSAPPVGAAGGCGGKSILVSSQDKLAAEKLECKKCYDTGLMMAGYGELEVTQEICPCEFGDIVDLHAANWSANCGVEDTEETLPKFTVKNI